GREPDRPGVRPRRGQPSRGGTRVDRVQRDARPLGAVRERHLLRPEGHRAFRSSEGGAALETRMDDVRAVLDAVGAERAALLATREAAAMTTLFTAAYPERVAALVLFNPDVCG